MDRDEVLEQLLTDIGIEVVHKSIENHVNIPVRRSRGSGEW